MLVPRAICLFRRKHPEVAITLTVASSASVRDHVASGLYDIGLAAEKADCSGVDHALFATYRRSARCRRTIRWPASR